MKTKYTQFIQHLYHDQGDEEKAEEYLKDAVPLIGAVVVYFNSLEALLDMVLCETFSDRTDSTGLIVLTNMGYSAKLNLFKRFCDDFHTATGHEIDGYAHVIGELRECAKLRNHVVHANWEQTDEQGYTYVRLKVSKSGMQQEYAQFSKESLEALVTRIENAMEKLGEYWDRRQALASG